MNFTAGLPVALSVILRFILHAALPHNLFTHTVACFFTRHPAHSLL